MTRPIWPVGCPRRCGRRRAGRLRDGHTRGGGRTGIDAASRSALGRMRTPSSRSAEGARGGRDHWLGHQDGECARWRLTSPPTRSARARRGEPQTALTFGPDGFTGHADDRAVSHWVDLAVRRSSATPRVLHAVATDRALGVDDALTNDFGVYTRAGRASASRAGRRPRPGRQSLGRRWRRCCVRPRRPVVWWRRRGSTASPPGSPRSASRPGRRLDAPSGARPRRARLRLAGTMPG